MLTYSLARLIVLAQTAPKQIPPEVSNPYMFMGYAVVLLILFGMIVFMVNRSRRLRQEWALLIEMDKDNAKDGNKSQPPASN
jgi:Na+-transporting methylmalonyl-CoA/oxaloacetate decarboxylase gamma subunit